MPFKSSGSVPAQTRTELIKAAKRLRADGHAQTTNQIGGIVENDMQFTTTTQWNQRDPAPKGQINALRQGLERPSRPKPKKR